MFNRHFFASGGLFYRKLIDFDPEKTENSDILLDESQLSIDNSQQLSARFIS